MTVHLSLDRLLQVADKAKGWDRARLVEELDTKQQRLTNWKKRGVPRNAWPELAKLLGITIETMLDSKTTAAAKREPRQADVVLLITRAEVDGLDRTSRELVMQLVGTIQHALRSSRSDATATPEKKR